MQSFAPVLKQAGYAAKMIGSVAKVGRSDKDLDILLTIIPEREAADNFDLEIILNWVTQSGGRYDFCGPEDSMTVAMHLPDGRVVDLWFDTPGYF